MFIEKMKSRTKEFAANVIDFCDTLESRKASAVITYQLVKSATSTGASYRAACRARSKKEFFSKISIVVEEIDESLYWLEVIQLTNLSKDAKTLDELIIEATKITKVMSKARKSIS